MTISPDQPHRRLLFGLLDRYERGVCFGQPSGWAREPTLFWDERSFPDAFAPEGYELLTTLSAAAAQLEANGCLRIVRHSRGPLRGEPKELRLGSAQLDAAYRAADSLGYFRLAQAFEAISSVASVLSGPGFVFAYFHELVPALRRLDASLLGVSRQRLKLEYPNICRALTAAVALANGVAPAYERIISDRIFGNSKTLSRVRDLTASLLVRMDPRWEGVSQISTADLLEAYGVRRRPALIQCAGRGSLHINGRTYELDDFTPVAHLPESWTEAFVEAATNAGLATVTTVENEYPFLSYIESHGGSAAVGSTGELVVYTGGFPTPALTSALVSLGQRNPQAIFRHWGDADVGGLRILLHLRSRLGRPLYVFRSTAEWIAAECSEGSPLTQTERGALRKMQTEVSGLAGDDIPVLLSLIRQLLQGGVKIEQEHFSESRSPA